MKRGTNVVITILRTGGTSGTNTDGSGDILVPFYTSDGSARAGINYTAVTNNLDFPMGEVIQTVTIPVMDDNAITTNLTVNLALNPSPPAAFGGQPLATLTIINDDSEINFAYSTYTVSKDAINGAATINILRQGGVSGTSTVFFSTTSAGSATPVTDYTPVSQTVIFNPGVSNVAVTVPINNNGLPEGNRTVGMQLTGATGSLLYSPSNAVLTIIDTLHTPGQLAFSAPNYVITEGGGTGTTNAYITIIRTNGSKNAVTVAYSTADGTALAGVKYIPTNGTVSFGDGEMGAKTFAVQVINTTTAEGPEYLNLVLTTNAGSNGAMLTDPSTATLTILNTNIGVAFDSPIYTTTEPAPFAVVSNSITLNVLRFNTTNVQTTVSYSTTNGTAVAGTNFVATNGTVVFNPGETLKTIVVPLLYDPLVTGDLAFTVGLSNPSGTAQLTPPSVATVIVHDSDAGLSFSAPAMSVAKSAGFAYLFVLCSNPAVEPVSVDYFTSPGTAQPGVDYTTTSGTLKLTNGAMFGTIVVPISGEQPRAIHQPQLHREPVQSHRARPVAAAHHGIGDDSGDQHAARIELLQPHHHRRRQWRDQREQRHRRAGLRHAEHSHLRAQRAGVVRMDRARQRRSGAGHHRQSDDQRLEGRHRAGGLHRQRVERPQPGGRQ